MKVGHNLKESPSSAIVVSKLMIALLIKYLQWHYIAGIIIPHFTNNIIVIDVQCQSSDPSFVPAPTLIATWEYRYNVWSTKRHANLPKFCSIKSKAVIVVLSMKPSNIRCMCDMGPPCCWHGVPIHLIQRSIILF